MTVGKQTKPFGVRRGRLVGGPNVYRVPGGHLHVFQHHLVTAGGPHAEVIPAFHHADALAVGRNQPATDQRRVVVAARPQRQPAQSFDTGGINFVVD